MAKLRDQDRKEIIQNLIANEGFEEAGPWAEGDEELLGNMEDDKLIALDEARDAAAGCQSAAAAAREGFQDQEGGSHVFNEETGGWESRFKPKKKETPQIINAAPKPMTDKEWFEAAPESVQQVVNQAIKDQEVKKKELVSKLLANSKGMPQERIQKITENLWARTPEELQDQVDLLPQSEPKQTPRIAASAVPVGVGSGMTGNEGDGYDKDDYLDLPTINWEEEAKRP